MRGAPAIGVFAAFALYLAAKDINADTWEAFYAPFHEAKEYLNSSRATAVNLSWALNRMEQLAIDNKDKPIAEIKTLLLNESKKIKAEDVWTCRQIGENGLTLLKDGDGILTHCNAGQLATSKYGTALAPIHLGMERGMNFRVFCDETRPLLQGARLSAFELIADGVDTTVICDNMASQVIYLVAGKNICFSDNVNAVHDNHSIINGIKHCRRRIMAQSNPIRAPIKIPHVPSTGRYRKIFLLSMKNIAAKICPTL